MAFARPCIWNGYLRFILVTSSSLFNLSGILRRIPNAALQYPCHSGKYEFFCSCFQRMMLKQRQDQRMQAVCWVSVFGGCFFCSVCFQTALEGLGGRMCSVTCPSENPSTLNTLHRFERWEWTRWVNFSSSVAKISLVLNWFIALFCTVVIYQLFNLWDKVTEISSNIWHKWWQLQCFNIKISHFLWSSVPATWVLFCLLWFCHITNLEF